MTAYYHTCPYCGAHLDPGEICDCRQPKTKLHTKVWSLLALAAVTACYYCASAYELGGLSFARCLLGLSLGSALALLSACHLAAEERA